MDDIKKAMLGDKEAAERLTERGELLTCPFCGKQGILEHSGLSKRGNNAPSSAGDFNTRWRVRCSYCFCERGSGSTEFIFNRAGELVVFGEDGRIKAIESWNTRPQLLTKEQIEALERMEK